jgi:hypothetical protein
VRNNHWPQPSGPSGPPSTNQTEWNDTDHTYASLIPQCYYGTRRGQRTEQTKAVATKTSATEPAISAAENDSFIPPKTFKYKAAEIAVATEAIAMNANIAVGLRHSRSARDTQADMAYGSHAIKVETIGIASAK